MEKYSSPYLKDIKNPNVFYKSDFLIYIFIIINKYIIFLKSLILQKKEKRIYFFRDMVHLIKFPSHENCQLAVKNETMLSAKKRENKIKKHNNNKTKEYQLKKENNKKHIITKNNVIINIIKIIIINIFCKIKSNIIFDLFYVQYSSKITLKVKGIGDINILGNINNQFEGIRYLKEVHINGIRQNQIKRSYSFGQTDNIVELIWDDNLDSCESMFWQCKEITEINLSNFNTSKVTNMKRFFSFCSSLTSLDITNFNTNQVNDMDCMFCGCSSLSSLDLSHFETSKVTIMQQMFDDCTNLKYINLNHFDESQLTNAEYMFFKLSSDAIVCLKDISTESIIISKLETGKKCYAIDCIDDLSSKENKLSQNDNECNEICDTSLQYQYKYNGRCYVNCSKELLIDSYQPQIDECKCELDEYLLCPNVAFNNGFCKKCNIIYYPKENESFNLNEYIKCYNEPQGYYLENNLYKLCYYTCKTCNTSGNNKTHNCIECGDDYLLKIEHNLYSNCYRNCSYYYYFDNENNYLCTNDLSCPKNYKKLNENKNECIKINMQNMIDDLILTERNKTKNYQEDEEINLYDNMIKMIEIELTENYDTSKLDDGNDEVLKTEKMTMTFTTIQNQKNNINKNITIVDLGTCENLLRNYYNISHNDTIYMKKIEVFQEGFKIPKTEYDVYSKLSGTSLIKLNLTICKNNKITIIIPIELTENLDKLNSSSGYYNDICFTTTSEDGTDITLKDRKQDFINKNKSVCQEDCLFSKYDKEKMNVECSCSAKESSSSISNMNINKAKLYENFKDIKNIANLNFLVCYKKLFQKDGIINNYGCYSMLAIIFFHIITIFIFIINGFSSLKKKIYNIICKMNKFKNINKNEKGKNDKFKNLFNKISIYKNIKRRKINIKNNINNIIIINNSKSKIIPKINKNNQNNNERIKNSLGYIDDEINDLSYNLALKYDKRNYCQYYNSLIKTKNSLIFAFCNNNDYNSKIIKIDLFFIGFTIEYTVNALFYNDDTMHKIYESKGQFDLENQIPIIIYSTLISMILNTPINFLALSNDAIISFKQENTKYNIMKKARILTNKLIMKIFLYFVLSFLLLIFFWYYISMFCVIYRNTQIHLLKDTLMSVGLSLIMPFGINLLPGFFRMPALSNRKNKRKYLYNFSKFLQSF